jgi:hypothetical protein
MDTLKKATIVPLHYCSPDIEGSSPLGIGDGIQVQRLEGLLTEDHFSLWKLYLSEQERTKLASVRLALVNDFDSPEHVGLREQTSRELMYNAFVCLRLIRPTRERFQPMQVKKLENGLVNVFSFDHPDNSLLALPQSEVLNTFSVADLDELRRLLPRFLGNIESGPTSLIRAIRLYEEGYSNLKNPVLQIIVWVLGLQSVLAQDEETEPRPQALKAIEQRIGYSTDIYEDAWFRRQGWGGDLKLRVGDVLDDLFSLYDRLVKGRWVPTEWLERKSAFPPLGEYLEYPELLRGAASFLLRKAILGELWRFSTTTETRGPES